MQMLYQGGCGNPGGRGGASRNGGNGTGGLLIIYASNINNTSNILSKGTAIPYNNGNNGGGSGGGSINIFYKKEFNDTGTINANGERGSNAAAGGEGSISIGKINTGKYEEKYNKKFLIEVYDHLASDAASLSEIKFEDEEGNTIPYTVNLDEAYDSANDGSPYYWKNANVWNYTNLYDGNISHTTNSEGETNCTMFVATSAPNTQKYARFTIDAKTIKDIKDIKICVGDIDGRTPKTLSVYKINNYSSDTYANNVIQRDNKELTLLKTINFSQVVTDSTWYSFIQ